MQFVEHDRVEVGEETFRVARGKEERQLLRCRQENVGWHELLPLPLVQRRIPGSGFDADREADLRNRLVEVAGDIDGERLQRRNVERVDAAPADRRPPAPLGE